MSGYYNYSVEGSLLVPEVLDEEGAGPEVVHWTGEESLDLLHVQIHRDQVLDAYHKQTTYAN